MLYYLGIGKDEESIVKQAAANRQPIPDKILNAPEVELGLEIYWQAFTELNTCRGASMGGSLPIPFTAIVEYARLFELDEEQTADLLYYTRRLDTIFLNEERKKNKNGGK